MSIRSISKFSHTGSDEGFVYKTGDSTYTVVHLQEWEDLDSSAIELCGKYNVVAHQVDVKGYGHNEHINALSSCGYYLAGKGDIVNEHDGEIVAQVGDKHYDLVIVDAMYGYGAGDRVLDDSGNNRRTLLREARRYV